MAVSQSGAEFNEIVVLLKRNDGGSEEDHRDPRDLEDDLKRLLLMSRDNAQRGQMIQAQAVRRISTIAKSRAASSAPSYCSAILCNLAQVEKGRLSASSCDRWYCVSHRHNCPIAMLLDTMASPTNGSSSCLRQLCAAALLSFSVQNECQMQLDLISGVPILLKLFHETNNDADLRVYVAAILWNLAKSPLLMLKLETIHGILKDQLMRKLTDVLWTPLEPFHLAVTATGERGTSGLIESDSVDNLGVMLAASVSTQLTIVLRIENYTGRARSLTDQYRAKTPLKGRAGGSSVGQSSPDVEAKSVPHFDESGVLKSRSCGVCGKAIKLRKRRKNKAGEVVYLVCARDGCDQTFHAMCSRWKTLSEAQRQQHAHEFHCGVCVVQTPGVHFCDFIADNSKHDLLIAETRFKSVGIQRVQHPEAPLVDGIKYSALISRQTQEVVAVGVKKYRVPHSSQDLEMFVVDVRYILVNASPATHQQVAPPAQLNNSQLLQPGDPWQISYAREGATLLPVVAGGVVFWAGPFMHVMEPTQYIQRPLAELEAAFVYEFQGETAQDKAFCFGNPTVKNCIQPSAVVTLPRPAPALWTTLSPRKGLCMKTLAEQIGRLKQMNDLLAISGTDSDGPTEAGAVVGAPTAIIRKKKKERAKPHVTGRKLNKIAVGDAV